MTLGLQMESYCYIICVLKASLILNVKVVPTDVFIFGDKIVKFSEEGKYTSSWITAFKTSKNKLDKVQNSWLTNNNSIIIGATKVKAKVRKSEVVHT